jgi:uncharacterized membrane protein YgcG
VAATVSGPRPRPRIPRVIAALILALGFAAPSAVAALTLPPSQEGVAVYDLADVWQPATIAQAQSIADAIRGRTEAQIAVVSWPSGLSEVSTELAKVDALEIMNTWGVGRAGINDGLVVLFDLDDTLRHGQIYLYTGSGFRDLYLSDDEARSIVDGEMLPKAKDGDLDAALLAGLRSVDHAVQPGGNPDRARDAILHPIFVAGILAMGLMVLGAFLMTWWSRGRDARVVLIDDSVLLPSPPPGLTPALATVLRKDGVDNESFTSALVDLGHRGLLTFRENHGKKHVDLVLPDQPLDDPASYDARRRPLGPAEESLLADVRGKAAGDTISWSQLQSGRGKELFDAFQKKLGEAAVASGWFRDDPTKITSKWVGVAVGLGVAVAVIAWIFVLDTSENSELLRPGREYLGWPLLVVVLIAVAIAVLSRFLAARTNAGAQTLAMALAYRNTLRYELKAAKTIPEAVEKTASRLPWITTPDELTVWAVALGLRHEVDHLIKETFKSVRDGSGDGVWAPVWYSGSSGVGSVGDIGGMLSSISTTSASSSGSGYGGGSGGGGGGSGGGF